MKNDRDPNKNRNLSGIFLFLMIIIALCEYHPPKRLMPTTWLDEAIARIIQP